jgi:hypothetical protein
MYRKPAECALIPIHPVMPIVSFRSAAEHGDMSWATRWAHLTAVPGIQGVGQDGASNVHKIIATLIELRLGNTEPFSVTYRLPLD